MNFSLPMYFCWKETNIDFNVRTNLLAYFRNFLLKKHNHNFLSHLITVAWFELTFCIKNSFFHWQDLMVYTALLLVPQRYGITSRRGLNIIFPHKVTTIHLKEDLISAMVWQCEIITLNIIIYFGQLCRYISY